MIVKTRKIDVVISEPDGTIVFEKKDFEIPEHWSNQAGTICCSKYATNNENSARQIIDRVVSAITDWGVEQDYFKPETPDGYNSKAQEFYEQLIEAILDQRLLFNTPAMINLGVPGSKPQTAACFLGDVEDTMEDILEHTQRAGLIFRSGSGIGLNVSKLRAEGELLSNKGTASGPLSFMKAWDRSASAIKSGGKTRRAAVLIRMDADHPDIEKFIKCKNHEENKAKLLIEAGVDKTEAYSTVDYQNANHSVGVTDNFMKAVEENKDWNLINRGDKKVTKTVKAKELFRSIAESAWKSGDPGLQFHDRINKDNPIPNSGEILNSNPCQPGFATVLTPEGIRTFDDIDVGSIIWSGQKWTKVVRKLHTGIKEVYEYRTTANSFIGTKDHKVFQNGQRVKAEEAVFLDVCRNNFENILNTKLDDQAVVDGWVFGDGSIHKASGDLVYLTLGKDDKKPFLNNYRSFMIAHRGGIKYSAYTVQTKMQPNELVHTYERSIPDRYRFGSYSVVRSFLRGLYAANGSVCGGRVTLKASSFKVIQQVQEMLSSLGIRSYYTTNKKNKVKFSNGTYECKQSYDLNISRDRKIFNDFIGFVHDSKIDKLNKALTKKPSHKPYGPYAIKETVCLGTYSVYDITVDSSEHSYWTNGVLVSNCSEIYGVPWTACQLCVLNIVKYLRKENSFDYDKLRDDVQLIVLALDIMLDKSYYPTDKFREVATKSRPLGIGITDLGGLLMRMGIPYDSDDGRSIAEHLMDFINSSAANYSIKLAKRFGPFEWYEKNKDECNEVICRIGSTVNKEELKAYGIRNSQLTTAQPSGTTGLILDSDALGIEPLFAKKMLKTLVGGGTLEIDPECIKIAKENHSKDSKYTLESITATANEISWKGHIDMVAALQHAISGGLSKTVNLQNNSTTKDIEEAYMYAWKEGLKGVTVYRDGSKELQPLTDSSKRKEEPKQEIVELAKSTRIKLPTERKSVTRKFDIQGHEGYITVGMYENGAPGELFISMNKQGSMISGLLDSFATLFSISLQYGVPLAHLIDKMKGTRFEPSGFTQHEEIPIAKSIMDYIGRWLELKFLSGKLEEDEDFDDEDEEDTLDEIYINEEIVSNVKITSEAHSYNGEVCTLCGGMMVQTGSCSCCSSCGESGGCS